MLKLVQAVLSSKITGVQSVAEVKKKTFDTFL